MENGEQKSDLSAIMIMPWTGPRRVGETFERTFFESTRAFATFSSEPQWTRTPTTISSNHGKFTPTKFSVCQTFPLTSGSAMRIDVTGHWGLAPPPAPGSLGEACDKTDCTLASKQVRRWLVMSRSGGFPYMHENLSDTNNKYEFNTSPPPSRTRAQQIFFPFP
jgi:hypothetical protein